MAEARAALTAFDDLGAAADADEAAAFLRDLSEGLSNRAEAAAYAARRQAGGR